MLSRYFEDESQLERGQVVAAQALLTNVHDVIDDVCNCPRHDGEMQRPRYVRYEPIIVDADALFDPRRLEHALLPDGLHVDTNNGHLFRHVTAILYLTDEPRPPGEIAPPEGTYDAGGGAPRDRGHCFVAGGGTTFPLADPPDLNRIDRYKRNNLQGAARRLLERGIHHTKGDVGERATHDGRALEGAGLDTFYRDHPRLARERYDYGPSRKRPPGVRVVPAAGKLIYFHNVDDAGAPDPRSFHGAEELLATLPAPPSFRDEDVLPSVRTTAVGIEKSILVFFKEIPVRAFRDRGREGFAAEARRCRSWTKKRYF